MSNGNELALANVANHEQFLTQQAARLSKWCAAGIAADALQRHALLEMQQDDKLRRCTPTSIYLSLLACAVTGLVPGKLRGYSFLVPFGNKHGDVVVQEATFMMGWRGVKHIGFRAGLDMVSEVIHENDAFDYDKGSAAFVKYRAALRGRGPIVGAAAWAKLPRGGLEVEFLDTDTLDKIKKNAERRGPSPAWSGPFFDQMMRKSALRRLGKQLEMGEEFFKGHQVEDAQDDTGSAAAVLDVMTDGDATRAVSSMSTEAAAFGGTPRPAQVQSAGIPDRASNRTRGPRVVDAQATERPTTAGGNSKESSPATTAAQQTGSSSSSSNSNASSPGSSSSASSPTTPTPATSTAGSASAVGSAASPAGAPPSSPATASTSTASGPASPNASGVLDEGPAEAGSPSDGDAFDTAFGDEPGAAPAMSMDAFRAWVRSVKTEEDLMARRVEWTDWAKSQGWTIADPKVKGTVDSPEVKEIKTLFAGALKEIRAGGRK